MDDLLISVENIRYTEKVKRNEYLSATKNMNADIKPEMIENNMIYCSSCGKPIHETAPTFPNCGAINKNMQR